MNATAPQPIRPAIVLEYGRRLILVANPARADTTIIGLSMDDGIEIDIRMAPLSGVQVGNPVFTRGEALIIEVDPADQASLQQLTRIAREFGHKIPVIAAVNNLTTHGLRRMRNCGVAEAISLPMEKEEIEEALAVAREANRVQQAEAQQRGKLISVIGCVGGAGATMLATQLGCILAGSKTVCLIDLNIQAATVACYLDIMPPLSVADLIEAGPRMDADLLRSVSSEHASGLRVIAGPATMVPLDVMTMTFTQDLLRLAVEAFDIVIVDLPPAWTDWSLAALTGSDAILLLSSLSVPGIRQAKRQMDLLEMNGLTASTRFILNRVPKKLFRTVDLEEAEKLVGQRVTFSIANDYPTVSTAIDQGKPLASVRKGAQVDKDIKAIAERLLADFAGEPA